MKIAIVIPVYNEETLIAETVKSIFDYFSNDVDFSLFDWDFTIIVVDDASTDSTPSMLYYLPKQHVGMKVITHYKNLGVGAAIATGYKEALKQDCDIAVVMAGDGQMSCYDLLPIVSPVIKKQADYVKGCRYMNNSITKVPVMRYMGGVALTYLTSLASRYNFWDIFDSQCGYTAISRTALEAIDLDNIYPGYGCPNDIIMKCAQSGLKIKNVPIDAVYGKGEKSGIKIKKVIFTIPYILIKGWFKTIISMDFTLKKYRELLCTIKEERIPIYLMKEYFEKLSHTA